MRALTCRLLLAALLSEAASAAPPAPLTFAAQIESELLAEEAILLLGCLAERGGRPWEFTGEARGEAWLKVRESNGALEGTYRAEGKETAFRLSHGESEAACAQLEPGKPVESTTSPAPPAPSLPVGFSEEHGNKKAWLWLAAGTAAVVAGFFLWKSRQPDHRGIEMR